MLSKQQRLPLTVDGKCRVKLFFSVLNAPCKAETVGYSIEFKFNTQFSWIYNETYVTCVFLILFGQQSSY